MENDVDINLPPPMQSMSRWEWIVNSAGATTWLVLLLITLFSLGLILLLWMRGRGPTLAPAILLVMMLPLVAGALVFINVQMNDLFAIAALRQHAPTLIQSQAKAYQVASGSICCFGPVLFLGVVSLLWIGVVKPRK